MIIFSARGQRSSPSAASAWIRVCDASHRPAHPSAASTPPAPLFRGRRCRQRRRRLVLSPTTWPSAWVGALTAATACTLADGSAALPEESWASPAPRSIHVNVSRTRHPVTLALRQQSRSKAFIMSSPFSHADHIPSMGCTINVALAANADENRTSTASALSLSLEPRTPRMTFRSIERTLKCTPTRGPQEATMRSSSLFLMLLLAPPALSRRPAPVPPQRSFTAPPASQACPINFSVKRTPNSGLVAVDHP